MLGADTVRDRETVQRHIGYLPGDFVAYRELTAAEYLRYLGNLRGGVDRANTTRLAKRLDLDLDEVVRAMSHGNRQKVGIVQAFQHDPELLILDEPTQGLDPLVKRGCSWTSSVSAPPTCTSTSPTRTDGWPRSS